jgi:scyllo-inositol 2-dehydrogenase (NADP+)
MNPLKVGIVGFGLSGRVFQAPFLNVSPKFELVKICSSRKSEISQIYPDVEVVSSANDIINDPLIDLVIVSTPNTEHFAQTKAALLKGKHVIVEKPFVTNIEEGTQLIDLAKKQNKVLAVFHNRRWDGDFKTVQQIIDSGALGTISEYEVHFDRFRPENDLSNWRSHDLPGSGVFFDLGPHLIDQAVALFGMPKAVFGDIRIARSEGLVDDTFEVTLYYEHHRAKLKAGVIVKELGPHFIIHGHKGSFVKYGLDPQENLLKSGAKPVGEEWGKDDEVMHGILNVVHENKDNRSRYKTLNGNYMGFFDNVYEAITQGKPLAVSADAALNTIRIILTAIESSQKKILLTI